MKNQKVLVRSDLAEAIHTRLGFSHSDAFKLIEKTFSLIKDELASKRPVKIPGFATFIPYSKRERVGRNPKTGEEYKINSRYVLSFKVSPEIKQGLEKYEK